MRKIKKRVPTQGGVWERQLDSMFGVLELVVELKKNKKDRDKK